MNLSSRVLHGTASQLKSPVNIMYECLYHVLCSPYFYIRDFGRPKRFNNRCPSTEVVLLCLIHPSLM